MPQMSPLNWLMLFIMFILIFMVFNTMNYFDFFYSPLNPQQMKKTNNYNWKW